MSETIQTLLSEQRSFAPSAEFTAQANVNEPAIYDKADADYLAFWEGWAKELSWSEPWTEVLDWSNKPFAKWFVGGKINVCYNCVDRHVEAGRGSRTAIIFEGEPGDACSITYSELKSHVSRVANALKELGVKKGDRVCIYMPMVPELAYTMLACTRIGAAHSVVFGGFSAESLQERTNDAQAKIIVTADGGWRRGGIVALKKTVDDALELGCPTVEKVLVLEHAGSPGTVTNGVATPDYSQGTASAKDVSWSEIVPRQSDDCPCEPMDSEDLLYILYTSGSTGKPKGIVHTTGGYLTGVYATTKWVFDMKDSDIYWCTADCGWVTGHSYVVYGPMANCATVVMYEGAPDTPDKDRFWRIVEKHKVTILYTAPTAIRTFMKWGTQYPDRCDMSSLRLLGSVGEPINPEAWIWYHETIGKGKCPVVDTWWQTETGAIMITPLPGIVATKPGSATRPFPGIRAAIYNEAGEDLTDAHMAKVKAGEAKHAIGGYLVLTRPWPSMTRGIYGDPERFITTYWSRFDGVYFTGDGAKLDEDGYFWLLGRVDDVMLVAGHNISTMEVESALVDHKAVAEAAVIGKAHEVKGQAISAFVIIRSEYKTHDGIIDELKAHVAAKIGPIARPDDIIISAELPKTRSGKIMRRLLRDVAEGRVLGDTTTLADPAVVAALKEKYEGSEG
ncbi:MAG: acetate--CoA ligase [Fimbriimonadaceae bacterium]|nr:acetate--CoA ligase [Fimbriimonadaceae bacterium]